MAVLPQAHYDSLVEHAAATAPMVEPFDTLRPDDFRLWLADKPDDFPVEVPVNFVQMPGTANVRRPEELSALITSIGRVTDITDPRAHDQFKLAGRHESQHLAAAHDLGARATMLSIAFKRAPDASSPTGSRLFVDRMLHNSGGYQTTKLGFAAVGAFPDYHERASQHDVANLKTMKYDGIHDVGRRVDAYNDRRRAGQPLIPVPSSYRQPVAVQGLLLPGRSR